MDAPERIWAWVSAVSINQADSYDYRQWSETAPVAVPLAVEYIRADLVTPPQITDAMVEAACEAHDTTAVDIREYCQSRAMRAALAAALGVKE